MFPFDLLCKPCESRGFDCHFGILHNLFCSCVSTLRERIPDCSKYKLRDTLGYNYNPKPAYYFLGYYNVAMLSSCFAKITFPTCIVQYFRVVLLNVLVPASSSSPILYLP